MKTESLFGFLAGATLGALAGILFAPATGDETRKKIMDAASEGYDEAVEGAQVLGHKAHVRYRYARREMNALKKTLSEQRYARPSWKSWISWRRASPVRKA